MYELCYRFYYSSIFHFKLSCLLVLKLWYFIYFLHIFKCFYVLKHKVHINNIKFGFKLTEDMGHHHRQSSCLMLFDKIIPAYQENHAFILIQNVYKTQTLGCLSLELGTYTASCETESNFIHTGVYEPYLTWS
jgi:hypothetical protein